MRRKKKHCKSTTEREIKKNNKPKTIPFYLLLPRTHTHIESCCETPGGRESPVVFPPWFEQIVKEKHRPILRASWWLLREENVPSIRVPHPFLCWCARGKESERERAFHWSCSTPTGRAVSSTRESLSMGEVSVVWKLENGWFSCSACLSGSFLVLTKGKGKREHTKRERASFCERSFSRKVCERVTVSLGTV